MASSAAGYELINPVSNGINSNINAILNWRDDLLLAQVLISHFFSIRCL